MPFFNKKLKKIFFFKKLFLTDSKQIHIKNKKSISIKKNVVVLFFSALVIIFASYFLTLYAVKLAELFGLSPLIISFTVIAAATSVPDAIISFVSASKGDIDASVSNVFGSNIFDILIGLGLPLFLASIIFGSTIISQESIPLIFGLLISTLLVKQIFKKNYLRNKDGLLFVLIYLVFLGFILFV